MICNNTLVQYVPSGWDYKAITMACGSTSIHGDPLYCEACEERFNARGYAPHQCRHGKDMTPEGAFCSACEFGEG
jgi:hypothetical protein